MRSGRMSSWVAALTMASNGPSGVGGWPLALGSWVFFHTNDGHDEELGR